ncbi:MAG: alpha/beta hydrolase [Pseudomonadota bacterium]|nr:alpha/beta hydrolase [Pseudomonadota bacterium]
MTTRQIDSKPNLVLIPGGPGLSGETMRSLNILEKDFEVTYFDPPGTGGRKEPRLNDYKGILEDLTQMLNGLKGDIILCGHSFGGIVGAELFLKEKFRVTALICLSTPFSSDAFKSVSTQYTKFQTPELAETSQVFDAQPDNETFRKWLASYGDLYFSIANHARGRTLILNDNVSAAAFLNTKVDATAAEPLLASLKVDKRPKLFINGADDKLILPKIAKHESMLGGFSYFEVPNASHFVQFEQPNEITSKIINFLKGEGEKT